MYKAIYRYQTMQAVWCCLWQFPFM